MLKVVAHSFGPPDSVLALEPCPPPTPGNADVVVRMIASPINPSDRLAIAGAYPNRTRLPFVPGFEGVGVIEAVGRDVRDLRPGQRVLPLGSAGSWQAFKAVPADWCVAVPEGIADRQAALAYVNPLTARLMIRSLATARAGTVGVNAAASAIGRTLIRMIHGAGGRPIAIVRSRHAAAALEDEPVSAVMREGTRLPMLDAGLDAVGGASGIALAEAVRPGGPFLHYGLLSGDPLPPDLPGRIAARLRLFWLRSWVHSADRGALHDGMSEVFRDLAAGIAATEVDGCYPLDAVHAALARDADPARRGKVLLLPGSTAS